MTVLKYALRL